MASTIHDKQEGEQQVPISEFEQKLQIKLERSKNALTKAYEQCKSCVSASSANLESLWQYEEFRFGAYIFGLLSIVPATFFVISIASVIFVTTVLTSFVWTFFVCSALTIGLMILAPLLIGFSMMAGFFIVGYDVYQRLLRLKHANKSKSN